MSNSKDKFLRVIWIRYGIITLSVLKGCEELVDADIKEMFGMILGKLDSIDKRVDSIDRRVVFIDKRVDSIDKRVNSIDKRVDFIDKRVDSIDKRVTKDSVEIESIQSVIKTIAEVQKAHMDQNERDHEAIIKLINRETGLHSDILKNLSSDVRGLEEHQKIQDRELLEIKRKIG